MAEGALWIDATTANELFSEANRFDDSAFAHLIFVAESNHPKHPGIIDGIKNESSDGGLPELRRFMDRLGVTYPDGTSAEGERLLIAVLSELLRRRRAAEAESDAEVRKRIEDLEDTIVRLTNSRDLLRKLYRGKVEEVDRLTVQLEAVQRLLEAQKRTDKLDMKTIAAVTTAVAALLTTAVAVWGQTAQSVEDVRQAAIEVTAVCTVDSGVSDSSLTLDTTSTTMDSASTTWDADSSASDPDPDVVQYPRPKRSGTR